MFDPINNFKRKFSFIFTRFLFGSLICWVLASKCFNVLMTSHLFLPCIHLHNWLVGILSLGQLFANWLNHFAFDTRWADIES